MDATTFFLTYPQADIEHARLIEHLQSIKPVVWARVARERHEDGNWHSHCIVRFGARVRTRSNMRLFDVNGHHPNIQVPRRIGDVLKYCAKDGDYIDHGPVPGSENVYDTMVAAARCCDRDALDRCAVENKLSLQWANHLWTRHSNSNGTILEAGGGTECLQLQGLQLSDKPIVLIGPSGCGKTSWALRVSPKPALLCSHMDDLKRLTSEHKSIIFDDMDFKHLPRPTQIYICDTDCDRSIHCRNTTAMIPKNTNKIFTSNEYPFIDDDAIKRRITVYKIITWAV
jgi:hypothetical protein